MSAMKNYYVILGIASTASSDEIKAAFRRRALELHPDQSGLTSGPFLEAQEAYATLSDPERRQAYDRQLRPLHTRTGRAPEPMVTARPQPEPFRPFEPAGRVRDISLDSFENYHPSFDELFDRLWSNFEPVSRPKAEHLESLTVEVVLRPEETRSGGRVRVEIPARATCPTCVGHGRVGGYECWRCAGHGALTTEYPVDVEYPAGIRDGTAMRLPLSRFGIENFYLTLLFRVSGG
jgi:DnaJ-class molecular chaperone